ncbi:MAG: glycosyltransferase [Elusimicrobia bacterium]|nr:glycosyltransferase [Elusimicrobiota bacterium]
MKRLRVLQIIECGGPGGAGNQVAAIVCGLDKSRFEVVLVYAVRPGSSPAEYEALASGADRYIRVLEMTREISPFRDAAAWRKLYRIFRDIKPDIVHAHSSKAGFLARTAAWAAGVPRIYYSPRGYSFLQQDRSMLSRALYRALEASAAWIGETVAVSESEAQLARGLWTSRGVRVVRDAFLGEIPAAPACERPPRDEVMVCSAGRMSYPRNPEAFARLAKRLPGTRCVWIGGGEFEPEVRRTISARSLEGRLDVTGWLPHDQALLRLAQCDIFVHFSRWEGLANVVIEAMAAGLPVVASDIPPNRELVRPGENGWLVKDEDELFGRVSEMIAAPELRASLGRAGRERVLREFVPDRMLRELAALYSL